MLLKDCLLLKHDKKWLQDFSKESSLGIDDPAEIAGLIAESMLDPQVMKERMHVLRDEDIAFFETAMRREVKPARSNYMSADRLCNLDYGFSFGEEMRFAVPEDVAEIYRQIDTPEFRQERKIFSWIFDCMGLVCYWYGLIKVSDFGTLCRRRHDFNIPDEEITLRYLPQLFRENECACILKDNLLIDRNIAGTPSEEKLVSLHEGVKPGFPAYSEMKDVLANGYPSSSREFKVLKRHFFQDILNEPESIDAVMEMIWRAVSKGYTYREILGMLRGIPLEISDKQERELRPYMQIVWENSRMLLCNGNIPRETLPAGSSIFFESGVYNQK